MKKITVILPVIILLCAFSQALLAARQAKPEAVLVIKNVTMFAEEFQKNGVTGSETSDGVLPNVFKLIGLREFREITGHDYSVQIWDFKSAAGFNIADTIFHFYDLLSDAEIYKSRPFIIHINYNNEQARIKTVNSLKKIIPGIKEAGTKEY
jgi:hypothetical protein